MKKITRILCFVLIIVMLSACGTQTSNVNGLQTDDFNTMLPLNDSKSAASDVLNSDVFASTYKTELNAGSKIANANPNVSDLLAKYPYATLEEPAKIQGFKYKLKNNVEFMPSNTTYNIVSAPEANQPGGGIQSGITAPTLYPGNTNAMSNQYQPGTSIMKFDRNTFVPQKNKIYIDSKSQESYKVIGDAVQQSGKVEAPVSKPQANEVFESLYIPKQEIKLTKGNITNMAEGVTLVSHGTNNTPNPAGNPLGVSMLPAPDTSKKYDEFSISEIIIYKHPEDQDSKNKKDNEQAMGIPQDPPPTPNPEEIDAKGTGKSNITALVKVKGGNIRVYEPTIVCEVDLDGSFDIGFRSLKVESDIVIEGDITFEKEVCQRLYGYGIDFDSGYEIDGRKIAGHVGIGIYAVIGISGEITITVRLEQSGTLGGGVKGNFWPILFGVPTAIPYPLYNHDKFDVAVMLDGKIHAWAYVGPQITLNVLDYNLVTLQLWLGLEGDAVIRAQAGTATEAEMQIDLSLDFVVVFRAWAFNYPYEKYIIKENIYKNTFVFKEGDRVGADSNKQIDISPTIKVDGACAYWDTVWGSVTYKDKLGIHQNVENVPIMVDLKRGNTIHSTREFTDAQGKFSYNPPQGVGLLPTDDIYISIDHETQKSPDQIVKYKSALLEPIKPTVPFKIFILDADAFNDEASGTVSPANPCPGHLEPFYYSGSLKVMVLDRDGKTIRTMTVPTKDGKFSTQFGNPADLSGGNKVVTQLTFEGAVVESEKVEANLNALHMNVLCLVDGINAEEIEKIIRERAHTQVESMGIQVKEVETGGTIANLKYKKPYEGKVTIAIGSLPGYPKVFPVDLLPVKPEELKVSSTNTTLSPRGPGINGVLLKGPISAFEDKVEGVITDGLSKLVKTITIEIEYEGIKKGITFDFRKGARQIIAEQTNPLGRIITEKIDSIINPAEVVLTAGSSQMLANGVLRSIDGRSNTSVMVVKGVTYVPVRAVTEAFGGTFGYDSVTQKLTINLNGRAVTAYNGRTTISVNATPQTILAAPFKSATNTIMLPVSVFSEHLGFKTNWNVKTGTLTISQIPDYKTPVSSLPWDGVWETNRGTVILSQKGTEVTGTYDGNAGILKGTVTNNILTGTFIDESSKGEFQFAMVKGEKSFTGKCRENGYTTWGEWSGIIRNQPVDPAGAGTSSGTTNANALKWEGVWDSDFGTIILKSQGSRVYGTYTNDSFKLEGTVLGSVLKGTFIEGVGVGEIEFTLSAEGKSFKGKSRYKGETEWEEWNGTKLR